MKLKAAIASSVIIMGAMLVQPASALSKPKLFKDQLSYSFGYKTSQAFLERNIKVNLRQFQAGLSAGMKKGEVAMTTKQIDKTLATFQKQQFAAQAKKRDELAAKNLKISNKFMAVNKKKAGVRTISDGLQYRVLKQGTGARPQATDKVTVAYEGKLINGKVFDSSYKRKKDVDLTVNQVIKGWSIALQKMRVGSSWMIYIPAKLAYGPQGLPFGPIGPNEALIFKVELKGIKKSKS